MLQQQLSEKAPQAVNKATHRAWAQEYGVICLSGSSTFFTIDGADQPQFWPPDSLRQALKPSGATLHLLCSCSSSTGGLDIFSDPMIGIGGVIIYISEVVEVRVMAAFCCLLRLVCCLGRSRTL